MKYKKYLSTAFLAILLVPLFSAKTVPLVDVETFDNSTASIIEDEEEIDLGFDTNEYLPDNFDPYQNAVSIEGLNFMEEEEEIDLGFDTKPYLPDNFDPYKK